MGQCHCQNSWTWWLIESKMIDFHPNWVLWRPKRLSFQTPSSLTLITIFFHLYFFIVFYHFYLVFFFEIMILVCLFFSLDWLVFSYGFFVLCSFVFVLCVCVGGGYNPSTFPDVLLTSWFSYWWYKDNAGLKNSGPVSKIEKSKFCKRSFNTCILRFYTNMEKQVLRNIFNTCDEALMNLDSSLQGLEFFHNNCFQSSRLKAGIGKVSQHLLWIFQVWHLSLKKYKIPTTWGCPDT